MIQVTLVRTYETVFTFDTNDKDDALAMFKDIPLDDIYAVELEQCCVTDEIVKVSNEY